MANTSIFQAPQPIIPSSLARFVYSSERSDQGVTGLCGLPLAIEAFHALGLDEVCRRELQLKQRDRGPTEAQWVEVLTLLHLAGGTSLEDLRIFKQDDGLCRLWKIPIFPSGLFGANAAWYRLAVIALNLYVAMTHLGLPEEWRGERLSTARFRFLARLGRVIRHARRYVVVVSSLAAPSSPSMTSEKPGSEEASRGPGARLARNLRDGMASRARPGPALEPCGVSWPPGGGRGAAPGAAAPVASDCGLG